MASRSFSAYFLAGEGLSLLIYVLKEVRLILRDTLACQAVGLWLLVVLENATCKKRFFGDDIVLKLH